MRISNHTTIAALVIASTGVSALAQPAHMYLTEENGSLQSGIWVDNDPGGFGPPNAAGGDITPGVRAFSAELGGIPGFGPQNAGQTIHPGVFGDIEGTTIGVQTTDAMRVWDGSDFDEISGDDAGEQRMQVSGFTTPAGNDPLNPATAVTSTAANQVVNLDSNWITAGEVITEHLQFELTDSGGTVLNATQANALSEIYLVTVEFTSPTLGSTGDIYLTLGQNVSSGDLADAQSFVQNVIVPTPGTLPALGVLGLAAVRRRR